MILIRRISAALCSYVLLGLVLFACREDSRGKFDSKLISKIVKSENEIIYPSHFYLNYYGTCSSGQIAQFEIPELRELYNIYRSEMGFQDFLTLVLDQSKKLNHCDGLRTFSLDPEIRGYYDKMGFDGLIEKFFQKREGNKYVYINKMAGNQWKTIGYFCFLNNHMIDCDDYRAICYLEPTSKYY